MLFVFSLARYCPARASIDTSVPPIVLEDVLWGDVYFATGQSNMQFSVQVNTACGRLQQRFLRRFQFTEWRERLGRARCGKCLSQHPIVYCRPGYVQRCPAASTANRVPAVGACLEYLRRRRCMGRVFCRGMVLWP